MGLRPRSSMLFASDEERGKKDDDHKARTTPLWNVKHRPSWTSKRLLAILAGGLVIWTFIHYIPTDMGPANRQMPFSPNVASKTQRAMPITERRIIWDELEHEHAGHVHEPGEPPHPLQQQTTDTKQEYDGAIKFYHLASTLRAAQASMVFGAPSTNIIFAASDLTAAAAIIPIACEMANWRRNLVNIAIMGKSDVPQEEIYKLNGASEETCDVAWHDARPDNAAVSSDRRLEISVAGAFGHIVQFLQPVAVITADVESEDTFFGLGIQRKIREMRMTHIQIPKSNPQTLGWLARLDSAALKSWHSASFDVLVQAPLDSSGSIIRLLKSLAAADYTGFNPPRLIIELPHKIDLAVQNFLHTFLWPPPQYYIPGQNEQLTIRHRISEHRADASEASLRFIESFYPTTPDSPHVLLLSPQAELSPVFFHYLKLHLLEFRHSAYTSQAARDLFGISLEAPSTYLNGTAFQIPLSLNTQNVLERSGKQSFRWQAPNSNAALYFADKWMEVHSFLTKRNTATSHPSTGPFLMTVEKEVAPTSPAWVEYFLELMKTRGAVLHYPAPNIDAASSISEALAITHNELYQLPEEFGDEEKAAHPDIELSEESVLSVKDDYLAAHHPETKSSRALNLEGPLRRSMDSLLPPPPPPKVPEKKKLASTEEERIAAELPWGIPGAKAPPPFTILSNLTLLDYVGTEVSEEELLKSSQWFRYQYRQSAGGCSDNDAMWKEGEVEELSAEDLFCHDVSEPPSGSLHEPESRAAPVEDGTSKAEITSKPKSDSPESEPENRIPGSGGVAANIDRVRNAANYQATAEAGLKKKLGAQKDAAAVPTDHEYPFARPKSEHLNPDDITSDLTRAEEALKPQKEKVHEHERDAERASAVKMPGVADESIFARPRSERISIEEIAAEVSRKEAALRSSDPTEPHAHEVGALPDPEKQNYPFARPKSDLLTVDELAEETAQREKAVKSPIESHAHENDLREEGHIPGSDGVTVQIDRVQYAKNYQATVAAGFAKKISAQQKESNAQAPSDEPKRVTGESQAEMAGKPKFPTLEPNHPALVKAREDAMEGKDADMIQEVNEIRKERDSKDGAVLGSVPVKTNEEEKEI